MCAESDTSLPIGIFEDGLFRQPYGLAVFNRPGRLARVYVTDNYEIIRRTRRCEVHRVYRRAVSVS